MTKDDMQIGICRYGHHLAYGIHHGFGVWLPDWARHTIVHVWNWTSCLILGHSDLVQDHKDGAVECSACLRTVPDPGEGTGVCRVWQIEEETIEEYKDWIGKDILNNKEGV
jgi:hypothetical protein